MTDPQAILAGVLREHRWHHTRETHCACGFRTPFAQLAVDGYEAHVAQAQAAALAEWLRSDEQGRLATAWFQGAAARATGIPMPNPYLPEGAQGSDFHPSPSETFGPTP